VLRRLRQLSGIPHVPVQTAAVTNSYQQHTPLQMRTMEKTPQHPPPPRQVYQYSKLHQLHQHRSLDLGPSSSLSNYPRHAARDGRNSPAEAIPNILIPSRLAHSAGGSTSATHATMSMRPLRVSMIRDVQNGSSSGNGATLPNSSSRRRAQYRGKKYSLLPIIKFFLYHKRGCPWLLFVELKIIGSYSLLRFNSKHQMSKSFSTPLETIYISDERKELYVSLIILHPVYLHFGLLVVSFWQEKNVESGV